MPGNHGLRLDNDQGFGPALPQPAEDNPEQPIEAMQFGPGLLPLEDGELLAKSDGFQGEFVTWQKKVEWHSSTRLIFIRDGILMTHRDRRLHEAKCLNTRGQKVTASADRILFPPAVAAAKGHDHYAASYHQP